MLMFRCCLGSNKQVKPTSRSELLEASHEQEVPKSTWQLLLEKYGMVVAKVLIIAIYFIVCVAVLVHWENWSIVEAIYYLVVTITTVGYGDYYPTTDKCRLFCIFASFLGFIFVFSIVSNIIQSIIGYLQNRALEKLDDDLEDLKTPHHFKVMITVGSIAACIFIGTAFMIWNENWTFIKAFYWAYITTVTVGYGDLNMEYNSSRIFAIFYIIVSVSIVSAAIGNLISVYNEIQAEKKKLQLLQKKLDIDTIMNLDKDGNGVSEVEFLVGMLEQTIDLDRAKDVDPWLKRFRELDKSGEGKLDHEDLRIFAMEQKMRAAERLKALQAAEVDETLLQKSLQFMNRAFNSENEMKELQAILEDSQSNPGPEDNKQEEEKTRKLEDGNAQSISNINFNASVGNIQIPDQLDI